MKLMEDRKYLRTLAWWGVVALVATLLVIRAKTQAPTPRADADKPVEAAAPAPVPVVSEREVADQSLTAVLWTRTSAEYRALCHQAYNAALERIRWAFVSRRREDSPLALVVDCPGAILDRSRSMADRLIEGKLPDGTEGWDGLASEDLLPGALDLLKAADELGVAIFYATNRPLETQEQAGEALKGLQALGLPQAGEDHLLARTSGAEPLDKMPRFAKVAEEYDIVLYLGDSVDDLPLDLEDKSAAERCSAVDQEGERFGTSFILIPNPAGSEWERALVPADASPADRNRARREALRQSLTVPND